MSEKDHDTTECLMASLKNSGYPKLEHIDALCLQGTATLSGTIDSYWLKQMAQVVAARTPGVHRVRNRIRVVCQC